MWLVTVHQIHFLFFLEHSICCSLLPIAVIKDHDEKQVGEKRADLVHSSQTHSMEGSQGRRNSSRNLEGGTEAETIEERYLLAFFQ